MLPHDPLPDSKPTSDASRPFGDQELAYLSKLGACMQYQVELNTVKMWLEKAQRDGLDPQRLYQAATETRLPQWEPAPLFESVKPLGGGAP